MADPRIYTIGWISATEIESVAAQQFFDERHPIPEQVTRHDNNVYALGRIGHHNVVMACLPMGEYGSTTATRVARDILNSFPNVCLGLMVGVGGGAPTADDDIRLGDVVVSSTANNIGGVFQYDYGKTIQDQAFQYTRMLDQPPKPLRLAVSTLKAQYRCDGHQLDFKVRQILEKKRRLQKHFSRPADESDVLYRSNVVHHEHCGKECAGNPSDLVPRRRRGEDEDLPVIHYGLIASGNQLMMDAVVRDKLAAGKGALCFEMEAAGLMNHFPCLVVRGISNYADTHKNGKWEGYAAMAAAAYAKDVLSHIPETKAGSERSLNEELSSGMI
ncbi:nucleoside phosphorylase domain-containing protein [Plectosphaerella plurivora]|uniref:Nucleoside phosphorylase domain-containing protein n=1 Tax=Plectosphaerella plurivora TaxID=936078 RepID=A0A9P8VL51_9PEZI|nr:nucleoside phosphorylase domain-containing protein [Plectosphaerella plurivora]